MRKVILVPDVNDVDSVYWQNFVQRVRDALIADGLACQVFVVQDVSKEETTSAAKPVGQQTR